MLVSDTTLQKLVRDGIVLNVGGNFIGLVGGSTILARDEFSRPTDTNAYAAGDAVSATTSDTGTTALRALSNIGRVQADTGYITKVRLATDQAANVAVFRLHFYTVAAPTTALVGDNVALVSYYANFVQKIGEVDLVPMTTSTVAGASTMAKAENSTIRMAFALDAASRSIYYRLETLTIFTPANAQKFYLEVAAETN